MEDFLKISFKSYTAIADVTPNTNGLKTAEKQDDGSFRIFCKNNRFLFWIKGYTACNGC